MNNDDTSLNKNDHLYLIDGSTFIFRAYHALPPLTRKSDGLPVGAVSGFCNMLYKILQKAWNGEDNNGITKPTHLAVIFDHSGKSFRNEIYSEYKAHRPPPPEDLIPQFSLIREAVKAFDIVGIEQEGFEADDIIATYATKAAKDGAKVTIISTDKDLMQLINSNIQMYDGMKDKIIAEDEVIKKFGVGPKKVIDVQSLAGDSVDNIPGVPGIGLKTGALLINEYGNLEELLSRAEEIKQKKRRESLIEFAEQARISMELVKLVKDVPVGYKLSQLSLEQPNANQLIGFLKSLEFRTIVNRVGKEFAVDVNAIEPAHVEIKNWEAATKSTNNAENNKKQLFNLEKELNPQQLAANIGNKISSIPINRDNYEIITDLKDLYLWIDLINESGIVAVDTETTSLDAMQADLVGISLAIYPGKACYIPICHINDDPLGLNGSTIKQLNKNKVLDILRPLLEDPAILKIGQNIKYDWLVLKHYNIDITTYDDTMLISYALDNGLGSHGMDALSERHLNHKPIAFSDIAGSGKSMITFDKVSIDKAAVYAAEDADITLRLWHVLKPRLIAEGQNYIYERLDRKFTKVLAKMEHRGITIEPTVLSRLSQNFSSQMQNLATEIYSITNEEFNIASPKQLGEILFGKMGFSGGKKTKTGSWSTGADVLEELALSGHELPQKILHWRQLAKLKSTYTDALPGFINPKTKRVHTYYAPAVTTTGRLSSSEPNLQNIPIRTQEGRLIRTAFVPTKGNKLISADYSQIELRLLAHAADIANLKQAFADGIDIHAMTASEIFNVPIEGMSPIVRREAKAINFGIIYGISAFGLANQLNISRSQAKSYIDTYFERFPGILSYMEETKEFCRKYGYVETIFGRRCHYPEINSKNAPRKAFMERAAINATLQGTAADIIKRAMNRMDDAIRQKQLNAKMLLQVHDELIFEVPEEEVSKAIPIICQTMENAPTPDFIISVPLKVEAQAANNWDEAR